MLGAAVLVWALVAGLPTVVLVLASIVTLVGFVLPLRKLFDRDARRAEPTPPPTVDAEPRPCCSTSPTRPRCASPAPTARCSPPPSSTATTPSRPTALAAGHRALREAAELLDGRPPANLRQLEEVDRRSEAIEEAAASLRARLTWEPAPLARAGDPAALRSGGGRRYPPRLCA